MALSTGNQRIHCFDSECLHSRYVYASSRPCVGASAFVLGSFCSCKLCSPKATNTHHSSFGSDHFQRVIVYEMQRVCYLGIPLPCLMLYIKKPKPVKHEDGCVMAHLDTIRENTLYVQTRHEPAIMSALIHRPPLSLVPMSCCGTRCHVPSGTAAFYGLLIIHAFV